MTTTTNRPLGANLTDGGVGFGVWAPTVARVEIVLDPGNGETRLPLDQQDDGTHWLDVPGVGVGTRYQFSLDGGPAFPDPRSRFQPEGVHGPSEVVDPGAFVWHDEEWSGINASNLSIYELHIGTMTPAGTFLSLIDELQAIADLGVKAIEIMPVADFPGRWNWGYDGVALFAPSRAYGRPEELQQLVDAAHRVGLGVLLDVVYNHLGPDGNYLGAYSPFYFTDRHTTPWGDAINYDGEGSRFVRDFVIDNAIRWVRDYHFDGLRLDASDTIVDDSQPHILAELQDRVRASTEREIVIIAEEARNAVRTIRTVSDGGYGLDAVWADDFHHEMRVLLSNAWENYYVDYTGSMDALATTINEGFLYQGEYSQFREKGHGTRVTDEPASAFVFAIQNHDQVGNRPFGERVHHQVDSERYAVASTLFLLVPETVLLFMGQEFAASTPFCYFTDHEAELGKLVTAGRRREFAGFREFASESAQTAIPDPQAESTFTGSRLDLSERDRHEPTLELYRELLDLRHNDSVFQTADRERSHATAVGARCLVLHRWTEDEDRLVIANFGSEIELDVASFPGVTVGTAEPRIVLDTGDTRFGGDGRVSRWIQESGGNHLVLPARTAVVIASR